MPKLKLRLCQVDQLGVVAECIGEIDDTRFKVACNVELRVRGKRAKKMENLEYCKILF
jgi:hypothetical protein